MVWASEMWRRCNWEITQLDWGRGTLSIIWWALSNLLQTCSKGYDKKWCCSMSAYGLIILQSLRATSWGLECHMATAALCSHRARQLGLEAPKCTCAALGASAKHKGHFMKQFRSVTLWGVWARCTGGTQWWTRVSMWGSAMIHKTTAQAQS